MRAVVVAMSVVVAGCRFDHGNPVDEAPSDAPVVDAHVIDAPIDVRTCPSAPPGCTHFTCASSTSCYYVCGDMTPGSKKNWWSARDACAQLSPTGCIATINSQAEQECIVQHAMPSFPMSNWIWIGYHQQPGTAEPLDGWEWQCPASSFTQAPWGDGNGEPDEIGEEDCAALTGGGGWFDTSCQDAARYLCEIP